MIEKHDEQGVLRQAIVTAEQIVSTILSPQFQFKSIGLPIFYWEENDGLIGDNSEKFDRRKFFDHMVVSLMELSGRFEQTDPAGVFQTVLSHFKTITKNEMRAIVFNDVTNQQELIGAARSILDKMGGDNQDHRDDQDDVMAKKMEKFKAIPIDILITIAMQCASGADGNKARFDSLAKTVIKDKPFYSRNNFDLDSFYEVATAFYNFSKQFQPHYVAWSQKNITPSTQKNLEKPDLTNHLIALVEGVMLDAENTLKMCQERSYQLGTTIYTNDGAKPLGVDIGEKLIQARGGSAVVKP